MDLILLQFESRQIPHRKFPKFLPARIYEILLGYRTEKTPRTTFVSHPTGMIHVGCERPRRWFVSSPPITRDHIPILIMFDGNMSAFAQLRQDRITYSFFVKRSRRLLC